MWFFFQRVFLIDIKVYKIRQKGLKNIHEFYCNCIHVEIAFSWFLLQNAFILVEICFTGHIIVLSTIYRSFYIFSFNKTVTALKHRGSFLFGSVYTSIEKCHYVDHVAGKYRTTIYRRNRKFGRRSYTASI